MQPVQGIEPRPTSCVALIQGNDRKDNIARALNHIAAEIDLSGKQRVLVKPNFVSTRLPLAATHVDAVRAVLEFVRERYAGPIAVAEGPSSTAAAEGFQCFGYQSLVRDFDVELQDLNQDEVVPVQVYDRKLRPLQLSLARTVVESDYRISVGPPKTHDTVVVTLSLKNMIMGSLISRYTHASDTSGGRQSLFRWAKRQIWDRLPLQIRGLPPFEMLEFWAMSNLQPSDKARMHQGYELMNLNLALVAPHVWPHLAVIDGFEAMEGNGPTQGTPVSLRAAITSTDALAADAVGTTLMGFQVDDVGYLHYCNTMGLGAGDLEHVDLVGNTTLEDCARPFKPHDSTPRQLQWRSPQLEHLLP